MTSSSLDKAQDLARDDLIRRISGNTVPRCRGGGPRRRRGDSRRDGGALLWFDTLSGTVCNRAYLVFDPPTHSHTAGAAVGESEVWGFENEHFHAPGLRSYLTALVADHRDLDSVTMQEGPRE